MHIHTSMPVYKILHHFHCERVQSFIARVHKVSLRACANFYCEHASIFEPLGTLAVQIRIRSHTRNETRAVAAELRVRSHQSSEYARSETLLSQRSFEYACGEASSTLAAKPGQYSKPQPHSKLCCDHCRSFDPFERVEASIADFIFQP